MSQVFQQRPALKLKRRRRRRRTQVQIDEKPKKATIWKKVFVIMKLLLPFLCLFVFIFCSAAVFYAYEKDCGNNFACPLNQIKVYGEKVTVNGTTPLEMSDSEKDVVKKSIHIDEDKKTSLTYWQAIDFIVISISTIGYGDIVPCTTQGQVIVIIVSIIGLPIMIIALNKLGMFFGMILHEIWEFIYKRIFKGPYSEERERQLDGDYVPLSLSLIVTMSYVMLCALYFDFALKSKYSDRHFTFTTAFYFTMITYMTVGYGDFAPIDYDKIFVNLFLILIGLALVALSIRIMRIEMEEFVVDVVAMIENKFIDAVTEKGPMHKNGKEAVREMLDERKRSAGLSGRALIPMISEKDEMQLQQLYDARSGFSSNSAQVSPDTTDAEMQFSDKLTRTFFEVGIQTDPVSKNSKRKIIHQSSLHNERNNTHFTPKKRLSTSN